MLSRVLIGLVGVAGAAVIGFAGTAGADPLPTPDPNTPNVNAYALVLPSEYSMLDGRYYAFSTSDGLTCVIERTNGAYGCSGPIPAAPDGATSVSGGSRGIPEFSTTDRPIFSNIGAVKALPPSSRLSFRNISCGSDGAGMTSCVNLQDQTGFVLSPGGSFILGE